MNVIEYVAMRNKTVLMDRGELIHLSGETLGEKLGEDFIVNIQQSDGPIVPKIPRVFFLYKTAISPSLKESWSAPSA